MGKGEDSFVNRDLFIKSQNARPQEATLKS